MICVQVSPLIYLIRRYLLRALMLNTKAMCRKSAQYTEAYKTFVVFALIFRISGVKCCGYNNRIILMLILSI